MNSGKGNRFLSAAISATVLFLALAGISQAQFWSSNKTVAQQAPTAKPASEPKPQPQVSKTETSRIGNWQMTCVDFVGGDPKRICSAKLEILQKNSNRVAFLWEIGFDGEKKLLSVLHVPTGVLIERGVELGVGKNSPSKIDFRTCVPNECTAQFGMDGKIAKDLTAASSVDAIIYAVNGDQVKFTINPDGLDRVVKKIIN